MTQDKKPRTMRNFWIELDVDGRTETVATGPRNVDGGFELTISMRQNGEIIEPLRIVGNADAETGELELVMLDLLPLATDAEEDPSSCSFSLKTAR